MLAIPLNLARCFARFYNKGQLLTAFTVFGVSRLEWNNPEGTQNNTHKIYKP